MERDHLLQDIVAITLYLASFLRHHIGSLKQILQDPGWAANDFREVYLGVGSSIDELLNLRNTPGTSKDRGESTGEAHGIPPITVVSDRGQALGLDKEVSPGQFAR